MAEVSSVGDGTWFYRAVPANMPLLAIYLLNIGQAIIAVFLSSEFIKRDRKQDTAEVFYVRSMSNASYVLGKAWSILSLFLIVNVIALLLALIFNALAADTSIDWKAYIYYPVLISIPTLVFIIGLSSMMMSIIRNQALVFVLLLGYILSSLIYLQTSFNYLFDYMAFHLPMFHSLITGFTDWETIWTLRLMYTCFGLSFIFISILLLKRLPQSRFQNILSLFLALGFLAAGTFLGWKHIERYQRSISLPQEMIALNNAHLFTSTIDIDKNHIQLTQLTEGISIEAEISGSGAKTSKEFVFRLNPGLKIDKILANGEPVPFERQLQLVFLKFKDSIPAGSSVDFMISYQGNIDKNALYIDIDEDRKYKRSDRFLYDMGKEVAFLDEHYLLLTPESDWYLQSGVGYSSESASWYRKDLIDYKIEVTTLPDLTPVSVGQVDLIGKDHYVIQAGFAQPHLSLAIGRYEKKSWQTDSIELAVYHIQGHDYFKDAFPDIRDTLPSIIVERLRDYERKIGLKYPFESFAIVEVPGPFTSYDRTWTSIHQHHQPGMVYFPEKGLFSRRNDFKREVKRQRRWGSNRNKTKEELQISVLNRFLERFYEFKDVDTKNSSQGTVVEESINPYYQFVQFYEMCNNLDSDQWPILNRIFESYLRGSQNEGPDWVRRNSGSTQNELANMILQEKSFAEVLRLKEHKELVDNVIELKGETLFSLIEAKTDSDQFRDFVTELLEIRRFENFPFEDFVQKVDERFGIDITAQMDPWFNEIQLAKYAFSNPIAQKVFSGNREMVQVSFKVSNHGDGEGVIKAKLTPGEQAEDLIYMKPDQRKEIYYLTSTDPTSIQFNTLISGNLPNQIEYNFEQIEKTTRQGAAEREVILEDVVEILDDRELVFDNEDPAFEFTRFEEVSRLRKWLKPQDGERFKYQGTKVWRPPLNWTATTNDEFYGDFIRSAFYIKAGEGDKVATWNIPLEEPGRYNLFYHVYKDESFNWDSNIRGTYTFTVPHQNGVDHPVIELKRNTPGGWMALGDYTFSNDTISISLTNESKLRAIFADAIKLVKLD